MPTKGSYSFSPLLYACKFGHKEIVEYFINKKSDLESFDCVMQGRRAIHYAVTSNNKDIVQLLIDKGADINAPDSLLMLPIHLACKVNNIRAAQLLMENNCNINAMDRLNRSPLQIAEAGGFADLIHLIKECHIIREIADEMKLKCAEGCNHEFCYTSLQHKRITTGKPIAKGGFSIVYLCTESMTGRQFAVKLIDKDSILTKCIEANINDFRNLLCHERIVKHFGAFHENEDQYIFMEFLEGGTLRKMIEKGPIKSPDNIQLFIKQLLEALVFLHERNIIHRDIKPDNVMLNSKRNLKLGDFGGSLLLSAVTEEFHKNEQFCGTSYYIAPEIDNGESFSCSVDIWSLGITVFELCTGNPPDHASTTQKTEEQLLEHMPECITNLIHKMLEKDQLKRPSAEMLLRMTEQHL